jgi:hypothetical protein
VAGWRRGAPCGGKDKTVHWTEPWHPYELHAEDCIGRFERSTLTNLHRDLLVIRQVAGSTPTSIRSYQEGTGPAVAQVIGAVASGRVAVAGRLDAPARAVLICQGPVVVEADVRGRQFAAILLAARVGRQPPGQYP